MDPLQMICVGVAVFGVAVVAFHMVRDLKSREAHSRDLRDRVEQEGTAVRVRLVPGRFTPASAGLACFVVTTLFVGGAFFVAEYAEIHSLPTAAMVAFSVLAGAAAGWFDYQFTLKGNAEGRWDLIVDRDRDFLQIPAPGAWGQATQLRISEVTNLTIAPLIPNPEEEPPILVLTLTARKRGIQCSHKVGYSRNEAELAAMREWILSTTGLNHSEPQELMGVAG